MVVGDTTVVEVLDEVVGAVVIAVIVANVVSTGCPQPVNVARRAAQAKGRFISVLRILRGGRLSFGPHQVNRAPFDEIPPANFGHNGCSFEVSNTRSQANQPNGTRGTSPPQLFDVPFIMSRKTTPTLRAITFVASLLVIAACGGGTSGPLGDSPVIPTNSTPPTEGSTLLDELSAAREVWRSMNSSNSQTNLDGGVGVSTGGIFGALVDSVTGMLTIWNWNETDFVAGRDFLIENPWYPTYFVEDVQMLDLTGDGHDDLFVDYASNHSMGKVFSDFSGSWKQLTFDGFESAYNGALEGMTVIGIEKTCLPDCAGGAYIPVDYTWDRTEFKGDSVDSFGNHFTMTIGRACVVFTAKEYEPYEICDKGEGIKYFQQAFADQGYLYDSSVDGYFGPKLEYSVKSFQYANNLPVTGTIEGQWYHEYIETYNLLKYGFGG